MLFRHDQPLSNPGVPAIIYLAVELFLNGIWFTLVVAAVLALLRVHRRSMGRRKFLLGLGALLCASALLFPSISITDDLHLDAFVIEDSNSTKRLVNAVAHAAPFAEPAWVGFIAFAFLPVSRRLVWRMVETISSHYKNPFSIRPLLGRAPPAPLSAC